MKITQLYRKDFLINDLSDLVEFTDYLVNGRRNMLFDNDFRLHRLNGRKIDVDNIIKEMSDLDDFFE